MTDAIDFLEQLGRNALLRHAPTSELERVLAASCIRKPTEGFKFTMCQMVTQSRWYGFTLGITVDNTRGGNCGGVRHYAFGDARGLRGAVLLALQGG